MKLFKRKHKENDYRLFRDCKEMPLENFIIFIAIHDISFLCLYGIPPKDIAEEQWEVIYAEYCCLVGLQSYNEILEIYKEIARVKANLLTVQSALIVLHFRPSEICSESLRELGYKFIEGPERGKYLSMIEKKAKTLIILLNDKKKEIDKLLKSNKVVTKETDLRKGVAILSKYMGQRIDTRVTTVYEYAMMQRVYADECNAIKARENARNNQ